MNPYWLPALALVALALALEAAVSAWRGARVFRWRDTLTNLVMYAGFLAIVLVWGTATYFIYDWIRGYALFDLSSEGSLAQRWGAAPWLLLVVLEDLTFYAFHRASHRSRFLWASHQAHHSSRSFNLSTGLRQTWAPFLATPFWLPLPFLGFAPEAVLTVQAASLLFQFFLHTQLIPSYGPLDWLLNSPRHHRAHHGQAEAFADRNFGGVFIFWDRLFGSFTAERPAAYGLAEGEPGGPLSAEFGPWLALARDLLHRGTPLAPSPAPTHEVQP